LFDGLIFKVADRQEVARAIQIRNKIFSEEVGHYEVDEFDDVAHHLIVKDEHGDIIAASRIVGPECRPLEIERYVALSTFLERTRAPAQTGRLWVRPDHRRVSKNAFIPAGMLKLAYAFARKRHITDFVMYAYQELCPVYRKAFYVSRDITFEHPAWGQVYLMHLDLVEFERRYRLSDEPMARLVFRPDLPNFLV